MSKSRNYNSELNDIDKAVNEKYAYSFDFDVMHPYMIRSFEPCYKPGSLLELGSYQGQFTRHFLQHFNDITCVEASSDAITEARNNLGDKVHYINALFEEVVLPKFYDNIIFRINYSFKRLCEE
jgi:16S rRNA A1518/A1519 N6-dimethyltransferase RsmA/KsgA/DIM1 with predicted DNA glycosylase/AP lyase activity